ncbi:MAG: lipopolysaccharide transport periplasmic protein LptA [Pseudomonadota bacterium]
MINRTVGLGVLGGVLIAGQVTAQAAISFGNQDYNRSEPVEVTSAQLDVDQEAGEAIFQGDVIVGQGTMRLSADRVVVRYSQVSGGGNQIDRVLAYGDVTLVDGTESAEGDDADYSVATGIVIMTGDVILTQGPSVINGDRLRVDLNDGTGVVEGNVRSIFRQGGDQ